MYFGDARVQKTLVSELAVEIEGTAVVFAGSARAPAGGKTDAGTPGEGRGSDPIPICFGGRADLAGSDLDRAAVGPRAPEGKGRRSPAGARRGSESSRLVRGCEAIGGRGYGKGRLAEVRAAGILAAPGPKRADGEPRGSI